MLRAFLQRFRPPILTRERVIYAYAVAIIVDGLQLVLGPVGWLGADELLDVMASILVWRFLGFHLLLLPTFALEFVPVADMLPTWTGCVAIVVALRRRQQARNVQPHLSEGRVIDIQPGDR